MNILVTGGAGFIGSHVADAFLSDGHRVTVLDDLSSGKRSNVPRQAAFVRADIRSPRLLDLFRKGRFDAVDHHAAQISVPWSVEHPREDADVNITGVLNLLECCRRTQVKKFIFVSSGGTVYGEPRKLPCTEAYPLDPRSPYGISKVTGEYYLRFYSRQYGLKATVLRYSNVYGPRQEPHGEAGVVAIFIKALLAGKTPVIFGDGSCVRDYVYAGDVARANVLALRRGNGEAFNIGTRRGTDVNGIYRSVCRAMGIDRRALHGPARPGDLKANTLDWGKARRLLGWSPKIGLEEGIAKTVEFFKSKSKVKS